MKTVNRKANIGERILIINAIPADWQSYEVGDIFTVNGIDNMCQVRVGGVKGYIHVGEYRVIVEEDNEMGVIEQMQSEIAELKSKVNALEKSENFREQMRKAVKEAKPAGLKSPQQIRDEIVVKAKEDVKGIETEFNAYGFFRITYEINREKRAIVALKRRRESGLVHGKGIAKADPSDCFNVHIGKAIALRRAMGIEVPVEYYNAPAPTEVRVGDVVDLVSSTMRHPYTRTIAKVSAEIVWYTNGHFDSLSHVNKNGKIIDDSRE